MKLAAKRDDHAGGWEISNGVDAWYSGPKRTVWISDDDIASRTPEETAAWLRAQFLGHTLPDEDVRLEPGGS